MNIDNTSNDELQTLFADHFGYAKQYYKKDRFAWRIKKGNILYRNGSGWNPCEDWELLGKAIKEERLTIRLEGSERWVVSSQTGRTIASCEILEQAIVKCFIDIKLNGGKNE